MPICIYFGSEGTSTPLRVNTSKLKACSCNNNDSHSPVK